MKEAMVWCITMKMELVSLGDRDVYDGLTRHRVHEQYLKNGANVNGLPGMLLAVNKQLNGKLGGIVEQARIVVCGNFDNAGGREDLDIELMFLAPSNCAQ